MILLIPSCILYPLIFVTSHVERTISKYIVDSRLPLASILKFYFYRCFQNFSFRWISLEIVLEILLIHFISILIHNFSCSAYFFYEKKVKVYISLYWMLLYILAMSVVFFQSPHICMSIQLITMWSFYNFYGDKLF